MSNNPCLWAFRDLNLCYMKKLIHFIIVSYKFLYIHCTKGLNVFVIKMLKLMMLYTPTQIYDPIFLRYTIHVTFFHSLVLKMIKKKQTSLLLSFFLLKLNHVEQTPLPMDNVIKNPAKSNLIFVLQYNLFSWCIPLQKNKKKIL